MIESYYNQLAPFYHYLFADWEKGVVWHAQVLDGVIQEFSRAPFIRHRKAA